MKVNCEVCGTSFNKKPKEIRRRIHNYCSQKCYHEGRKGKRTPIPGVYAIINILNFKIYCGSSYDVITRIYQHFTDTDCSSIKKLRRDMNLIGKEFFHFLILETVEDPNLLREKEILWIKKLDADYNTLGRPKPLKPEKIKKKEKKIKLPKIPKKQKIRVIKPPRTRKEFGKLVSLDETLQMIAMYNNGMTWFQISEACGIPQASVEYRVCRYRATLED